MAVAGRAVLESGEFRRLRAACVEIERRRLLSDYALARRFWRGLDARTRRDPDAYREAGTQFLLLINHETRAQVSNDVTPLVRSQAPDGAPRRVRKRDLGLPGRGSTFFRSDGAAVEFDPATRTVDWTINIGMTSSPILRLLVGAGLVEG